MKKINYFILLLFSFCSLAIASDELIHGSHCVLTLFGKAKIDFLWKGTVPRGIKAQTIHSTFNSSASLGEFINFDKRFNESKESALGFSVDATATNGKFGLIRQKLPANNSVSYEKLAEVSITGTGTKLVELDKYFFMVSCFTKEHRKRDDVEIPQEQVDRE